MHSEVYSEIFKIYFQSRCQDSSVGLEWWVLVSSGFLGGSGSSDMRLESLAIGFSLVHVGGVHGQMISGELLLGGNGLEGASEGFSLSSVGLIWGGESHGRGRGDEEGDDGESH